MAKIKHKTASETVGEEVDSTEWASIEIHEAVDSDGGAVIGSFPPSGFHRIYGLYAKKVGEKYHFMMVVEAEPEP